MVNFLRKRLQVFVSSTYLDLQAERQAAVEAILVAGHIPAGMELFTSGDESQMDVIKQWIDESDVFLLILGGRYGTVEAKSNKSYTQLEYEYAFSQAKPLFACLITAQSLELKVREHGTSAIELAQPQMLSDFRSMVLSRMVKFWSDEKDIKIAVGETLSQFARRDDLIGWVRPSALADIPALADEISRLSKENSELRHRKPESAEPLIHGLTYEALKQNLIDRRLLSHLTSTPTLFADDDHFDTAYDRSEISAYTDLVVVGLLTKTNRGNFVLTDAGRLFLNKYSVESRDNRPRTN